MAKQKIHGDLEVNGSLSISSIPNQTGTLLTLNSVDGKSISTRTNAQIIGDLGLASITGNVATASKLQTTRTLWGVNFDGSGNVTGALTGVTNLTATGTITAPTFSGSLNGNASTVTNGVYTSNFIRASTNFATTSEISSTLLDMSPLNNPFTWHDWMAFNRGGATLTWETSTNNGTSWTVGSTPMNLFIQKANTAFSLTSTTTAVRLTINSGNLQYSSIKWIQIMGGYSTRSYRVIAESSPDGLTWTNVHTSGIDITLTNSPNYFYAPPISTSPYYRITIYSANLTQTTETLNIGAIRLLTNRIGSQGLMKEYELPYDWDSNRKMIMIDGSFSGSLTVGSTITATGGNSTNWNTAFTNNHTHTNKAFLDTVIADATIALNITGSATKWVGMEYVGVDTAIGSYIMGYGADNKWHPIGVSGVKTWLGLGSNAYNSTAYLPLTGGTMSGAITSTATEAFKMQNDNGYLSAWNTAGTVRQGHLQFTPNSITLQAETGSRLLNLNPIGGNVSIGYTTDTGVKFAVNGHGYFDGQIISTVGFKSLNYKGMVGDYDQNGSVDKIIWTIGDAWNTLANMYGIGYSFNTKYQTEFHQMVFRQDGVIRASIGLGNGSAWFDGKITGGIGIANGLNGASYTTAQIEAQGTNPGYSFHYPGKYGASLYMDVNGSLIWGGNGLFSSVINATAKMTIPTSAPATRTAGDIWIA